uniref:Uncharacterized protein LOC104210958 n=1 Tax=Nicotiana sylvestris TaxID=4096 RepID=A0A1U7UZR8_NICSY|nr:PREDICTED: uncharacterized protein LOC104210958 [Nicotiana sylvestris]
MKCLWTQENNCMWKEVVNAKHGVQNHWCIKQSKAPHGVGVWKHICKLWEEFSQNMHFVSGNGHHIKFRKDKWLVSTALMNAYSALYQIAREPDSTICQNMEDNTWNIIYRRNLQDWEFEELHRLLATLNGFSSNQLALDQLLWGTTHAGRYSVIAAHKLAGNRNAITNQWPWQLIWKVKLPPKVICFNWTALHGACLTHDSLARRNFSMAEAESHNHLFLHCTIAVGLWNIFLSLFGLRWVMPQNFSEAFESWSLWKVDSSIRKIGR